MARTNKQTADFERKAAIKAANKAANPGPAKAGLPGGRIAPTTLEEVADSCSDNKESVECSGGDGGYEGNGYEGDSYDWGTDYYADESSWDDPRTSDLPTFPSGDNGDEDPCAGGVCQQVVITGERPEYTPRSTC